MTTLKEVSHRGYGQVEWIVFVFRFLSMRG